MKSTLENHQRTLKIIILGSGYSRIQEGLPYRVEGMQEAQLDIFYQRDSHPDEPDPYRSTTRGTVYVHWDAHEKIVYFLRSYEKELIWGEIRPHEIPGVDQTNVLEFGENILEIVKKRDQLEKNPFIELAREQGFRIDVESTSLREPPAPVRLETEWGTVTRRQMELPTFIGNTYEGDRQALIDFEENLKRDIESYDGVAIINGDGDGLFNPYFSYLQIKYQILEQRSQVCFADWCTCCSSPGVREQLSYPKEYTLSPIYCQEVRGVDLSKIKPIQRNRGLTEIGSDINAWLRSCIENPPQPTQQFREAVETFRDQEEEKVDESIKKQVP